jgi:hypothetical protein
MSQGDSQGSQEEDVTNIDDVTGSIEDEDQEAQPESEVEADDAGEAIEASLEIPVPAVQQPVTNATMPTSPDAVIETLRQLREDVGQISELSSEEGSIVAAFSLAFLKLMEPLTKALPVDAGILPPELGALEKANVLPKGDLVVLHRDGRMESIDLSNAENRDKLSFERNERAPVHCRLPRGGGLGAPHWLTEPEGPSLLNVVEATHIFTKPSPGFEHSKIRLWSGELRG